MISHKPLNNHPPCREWKDGLFSSIMRDQANLTTEGPKWIILDGDIDPMWIESLNTVMDDNKGGGHVIYDVHRGWGGVPSIHY